MELLAADEVETCPIPRGMRPRTRISGAAVAFFSVLEHSLDRDALRLDCPTEPLWFPRVRVSSTRGPTRTTVRDLQRVSLDGSGTGTKFRAIMGATYRRRRSVADVAGRDGPCRRRVPGAASVNPDGEPPRAR